jgi:type I restriction enzyme S subunit
MNKLVPNPDWPSLPLFDRSKWKRVRFGDVVKQMKEQVNPEADGVERYVAGEHMETENVHIRKWGTVGDGYLGPAFIRGFRKGQVLYGSRRTYLKKVAVAEWDGVTANTTFVIEAVEGKLLQELLPWIMLSERFTKHSVQESKGSTNPYINFPDIAKFEFDLPPLDQQRRIAEILWAVDATMVGFRDASQASDEALTASLGAMFSDTKNGHRHPVVPLSNVVRLQQGVAKGKKHSASIRTLELPYLRVANVQDGHLNLSEMKTLVIPEADKEKYLLRNGDVVICEGGDFDKVGRGAIWREQVPECIHQNHIFSLRADSTKVLPEFVALQLASPYGKRYFLGCAKKTSNLASINSTQVKAFPFQVPPLKEQRAFICDTSKIQTAREALEAHTKATRNSLAALTDAFT